MSFLASQRTAAPITSIGAVVFVVGVGLDGEYFAPIRLEPQRAICGAKLHVIREVRALAANCPNTPAPFHQAAELHGLQQLALGVLCFCGR